MLPGLLAVLIAGHVVGAVERSGRGYPADDRRYYGESGGYGGYYPYDGCGRSYAGCGYRGYDDYAYQYDYRSYSNRSYGYPGYYGN